MVVEDYAFRLAQIEGRIQELSPELNLPQRFYKPNPHFARNELPRLAIAILREANKPLATGDRQTRPGSEGCCLPRPMRVQGDADAPSTVPLETGRTWDHAEGWAGKSDATGADPRIKEGFRAPGGLVCQQNERPS
jgi:hypothetical protein